MCNFSDVIEEIAIQRGLERGMKQGMQQGMAQGMQIGLSASVSILRGLNVSEDVICQKLIENFNITEERARAVLSGN